jgi:glutathione synthase/RimK-type ligase-like ATP-grasp enzyme
MSQFPARKVVVKNKKFTKSESVAKVTTKFRPQIRSRHPSHAPLRNSIVSLPVRSVVRFGSTTELPNEFMEGRVEINTINAVKTSSNKLQMKKAFIINKVKTAQSWVYEKGMFHNMFTGEQLKSEDLPYPIVAKSFHGSRGEGNFLIEAPEDMREFLSKYNASGSIYEKYHPYNREYRLHVTKDGCFYTCRKVLKKDTPEEYRWFRNDTNSNWVVEENELFDKPSNWSDIEAECVKALNAVGLDIAAIDVRVQNETNNKGKKRTPDFIILETNSAPSLKEVGLAKYQKALPEVILKKANISISQI